LWRMPEQEGQRRSCRPLNQFRLTQKKKPLAFSNGLL
jgi:hypothetical protein